MTIAAKLSGCVAAARGSIRSPNKEGSIPVRLDAANFARVDDFAVLIVAGRAGNDRSGAVDYRKRNRETIVIVHENAAIGAGHLDCARTRNRAIPVVLAAAAKRRLRADRVVVII